MSRILVATDAWHPQVNGVVRSLEHVANEAPALGAEMAFLSPLDFRTLPMPNYREIRLAISSPGMVADRIDAIAPDFIHVATEGPIGLLTRRYCMKRKRPFTTSYHTRFPEYLRARLPVPTRWSYAWMRRFHNAGSGTMVSTPSLREELSQRGFERIMRWSRGVDIEMFRPDAGQVLDHLPRPIFAYVGRVSVEKNIEAFLELDLPGSKIVVGDGPIRPMLERRYPTAHFMGTHTGASLAALYASADAFVFPSLTDTFGIVLLEALASGLPLASYPVTGPKDVIEETGCGVMGNDLRQAALDCLSIPRARCREQAERFSWRASAREFLENVRVAQTRAR